MAHLESLAVSTPSANFVNPPSAYFNSLPDDSNNLYKYLNSITDAYPSSYSNTTNFEQTHIDPSHLSNSPFSLYSGENSNGWSYNPNLPNNNNGFNEASSPESKTYRNSTQARTNGNSLPKQRGVPVRTLSTDSNSLGEGNGITSQPVSRNHSRGNTASSGGSGNIAPVPKVVSTSGTGEEGEVRCLNCNTTVRFSYFFLDSRADFFFRIHHCGEEMQKESHYVTLVDYLEIFTELIDLPH